MTAAEQARRCEEAADKMERAAPLAVRYFRLQAQRIRSLGEMDAQSVEAATWADVLLSDGE